MHRLVAYAQNGAQRFAVDRSEMILGSSADCDVHLPFAGVSRRHARLTSARQGLVIEDLGSRRGLLVNGKKVRRARLEVLDEIRLGSIALLLEDVLPEKGAAAELPGEPPPEPCMDAARMHEHLARISRWVLADSASTITLETLVTAMLEDFGGGVLFLFQGDDEARGIKFVVATEGRWLGHGEEILAQVEAARAVASGGTAADEDPDDDEHTDIDDFLGKLESKEAWLAWRALRAVDRPYLLAMALPRFRVDGWSPRAALATLGDQLILGLVHHVGQYEPILFGRRQQADLVLAPGLVIGESAAMQKALGQLRSAVDPPVHVLLRGEPGTAKELLARSLHISGSRKEGPFVTSTCRGQKPNEIAAELFGAEIPGKRGPVVREGKLLEADGGTLLLREVDLLPFDLQDRLVRVLRSGEITPLGGVRTQRVDVRLIATSRGPLEPLVARDQFRLDLAHRLAEYALDIPPLRERREDLPLLIQAAVNRCCHVTGKRIQGITVQALEAMAAYDFPGNLLELENIVRQLVYLCPQGQPINAAMLPESVRLATIRGPATDAASELHLEHLVADTERAAIREALRRSEGNKSEASRLLKLSRNGLAMKMKRLGLEG